MRMDGLGKTISIAGSALKKGHHMTELLSFLGDKKIKDTYVKRLKAHAKADEFINGTYWENGKGCAVGCTIHSNNHNAYETELGIPEWLARLEDCIFEGLDNGNAKKFAVNFLASIPVGVNLEPVRWKFCAFILKENIERVLAITLDEKLKQKIVESIHGCLKLHENSIRTGKWDESAAASAAWSAESAANAAWSAAWSAASAARSAAWSAESAASAAASAAWSAESAESAAASAAWSAESAESAARSAASAAYERYADKLLELLKDSNTPAPSL